MRAALLAAARERICRGCGCTERRACPGGCAWALVDVDEDGGPSDSGVCTTCAKRLHWHMGLLATVGWDPQGFAAALAALEAEQRRGAA